MNPKAISRREVLRQGMTLAGLALLSSQVVAQAAPLKQGETVIPWLDRMAENPVPHVIANQLEWEELDSWITPNEKFFSIAHYDRPEIDVDSWQLEISGLVRNPMKLTLDDIKSWPRQELSYTIECAGNTGLPFFHGGIGNAVWAGTPLSAIMEEAGILDDGIEIVFYGSDAGEEEIGGVTVTQNFARSMSVQQALHPYTMLCYDMNGEPLPVDNGYPLRLIAPGWYGIANVKWLKRIEVINTRLMSRFMARDYVTLRSEDRNGETVWTETSVTMSRLKSAPARVVQTEEGYRIEGAAWGAPIARVEVQIDDGPWQEAQLDPARTWRYTWKFWTLDWADATPGEHTVTARAIDTGGNVQPAADDPFLTGKMTYWESNGQITRAVEFPA